MASGVDRLREKHRHWWHDYYRQSFVSFPDTRLEGFYWIQLYKMASGTRENGALLDLLGPWFKYTDWPCHLVGSEHAVTYWPMMASNHLELGEPLYRLLDERRQPDRKRPQGLPVRFGICVRTSGPDFRNSHFVERPRERIALSSLGVAQLLAALSPLRWTTVVYGKNCSR